MLNQTIEDVCRETQEKLDGWNKKGSSQRRDRAFNLVIGRNWNHPERARFFDSEGAIKINQPEPVDAA